MDERLLVFLWFSLIALSFRLGCIHSARVKLETKYAVIATFSMVMMEAARMTNQRRW